MRRLTVAVVVLGLVVPLTSFAQLKTQASAPNLRQELRSASPQSLIGMLGLDPSKFHMQQSYSLSFFSLGGHTISQGLYLNTMTYRFSPKLVARLQLGMLHQPFGGFSNLPSARSLFVSGAEIRFQPRKNLTLHLQYGAVPRGYYGYGPYGYRSYYDRGFGLHEHPWLMDDEDFER
ncbi:MAG: hypothetical protein GXO73_11250 [Calditrichaeota bacterium]|nr:hypothetical protein [Calditrichota bacterium]